MLSKLNLNLDIQFGQRFDGEKARRLVDELRRLQLSVNSIVDELNTLAEEVANPTPPTTAVHELADTGGLGPEHTVSGLTAGQVLVAIGDTAAAFRKLQLGQLADVDPTSISSANEGDVMQLHNGYWSARPVTGLLGTTAPSVDAVLGWDIASASLVWRKAGTNITLNPTTISAGTTAYVDDSEFTAFFQGP